MLQDFFWDLQVLRAFASLLSSGFLFCSHQGDSRQQLVKLPFFWLLFVLSSPRPESSFPAQVLAAGRGQLQAAPRGGRPEPPELQVDARGRLADLQLGLGAAHGGSVRAWVAISNMS